MLVNSSTNSTNAISAQAIVLHAGMPVLANSVKLDLNFLLTLILLLEKLSLSASSQLLLRLVISVFISTSILTNVSFVLMVAETVLSIITVMSVM